MEDNKYRSNYPQGSEQQSRPNTSGRVMQVPNLPEDTYNSQHTNSQNALSSNNPNNYNSYNNYNNPYQANNATMYAGSGNSNYIPPNNNTVPPPPPYPNQNTGGYMPPPSPQPQPDFVRQHVPAPPQQKSSKIIYIVLVAVIIFLAVIIILLSTTFREILDGGNTTTEKNNKKNNLTVSENTTEETTEKTTTVNETAAPVTVTSTTVILDLEVVTITEVVTVVVEVTKQVTTAPPVQKFQYTGLHYDLGYGYVSTKTDPLNLREQPDKSSKILTTIPKGAEVYVCSIDVDGWYYTTYNGKSGYVSSDYISFDYYQSYVPVTAVVATQKDPLNLRQSASMNGTIITAIPKGSTVTVIDYGYDWCYVSWSGFTGYAKTDYLSF